MTITHIGPLSKPIISEDKIDIDDKFYAHYCVYLDGKNFARPDNAWYLYKKRDFVIPTTNERLSGIYTSNVALGCYEHVSVCINGEADFLYKSYGADETPVELNDVWNFGSNNLENGLGYLPEEAFNRIFKNNYETCCIIPIKGSDRSINFNFELITNNVITVKNYEWIHVAYGSVELNETTYNQKQTIYNVDAESQLNMSGQAIAIACYTD